VEPTFVVANAKAYKKEHEDQALRQLLNSGCNFRTHPDLHRQRTPRSQESLVHDWGGASAWRLLYELDRNAAGWGFEYHLLAIAIGLAVFIKGSGAMSVDRALTQHLRRPGEAKKERFAA